MTTPLLVAQTPKAPSSAPHGTDGQGGGTAAALTETVRDVTAVTAAGLTAGAVLASAPVSLPLVLTAGTCAAVASFGARETFDAMRGLADRWTGRDPKAAGHDSLFLAAADFAQDAFGAVQGRGEPRRMGRERREALARDTLDDLGTAALDGASAAATGWAASAVMTRFAHASRKVNLKAARAYVKELDPTNAGRILTGDLPAGPHMQVLSYTQALREVRGARHVVQTPWVMRTLASTAGALAGTVPGTALGALRGAASLLADDGRTLGDKFGSAGRNSLAGVADVALTTLSGGLSSYAGQGLAAQFGRVVIDGATNLAGAELRARVGENRTASFDERASALLAGLSGTVTSGVARRMAGTGAANPKHVLGFLRSFDHDRKIPDLDEASIEDVDRSHSPRDRVEFRSRAYYLQRMNDFVDDVFAGRVVIKARDIHPDKEKGFAFFTQNDNIPLRSRLIEDLDVMRNLLGVSSSSSLVGVGRPTSSDVVSFIAGRARKEGDGKAYNRLIVSAHGGPRELRMGGGTVGLGRFVGDLVKARALRQSGQIVLTGCNVAGSPEARAEMRRTAATHKVEVVASTATNHTGYNLMGRVVHAKPSPPGPSSPPPSQPTPPRADP